MLIIVCYFKKICGINQAEDRVTWLDLLHQHTIALVSFREWSVVSAWLRIRAQPRNPCQPRNSPSASTCSRPMSSMGWGLYPQCATVPGKRNAFCLRHVGDTVPYSVFIWLSHNWVGASQSEAGQPIRTSVSETVLLKYGCQMRPMNPPDDPRSYYCSVFSLLLSWSLCGYY